MIDQIGFQTHDFDPLAGIKEGGGGVERERDELPTRENEAILRGASVASCIIRNHYSYFPIAFCKNLPPDH